MWGIFASQKVAPSVLDVECRDSLIIIARWDAPFVL